MCCVLACTCEWSHSKRGGMCTRASGDRAAGGVSLLGDVPAVSRSNVDLVDGNVMPFPLLLSPSYPVISSDVHEPVPQHYMFSYENLLD